jgi:hypothetical protein
MPSCPICARPIAGALLLGLSLGVVSANGNAIRRDEDIPHTIAVVAGFVHAAVPRYPEPLPALTGGNAACDAGKAVADSRRQANDIAGHRAFGDDDGGVVASVESVVMDCNSHSSFSVRAMASGLPSFVL